MSDDEITLTWPEVAMAVGVGMRRQLSALRRGLPQANGCEDTWTLHVEGACGELAVAKRLNLYWGGTVDTFKVGGDIGDLIEVRTRSESHYDLIVRERDRADSIYVLVTGRCPSYVVRGWLRGKDAAKPEFLRGYAARPEAYFVPQGRLASIDDLVSLLKANQ